VEEGCDDYSKGIKSKYTEPCVERQYSEGENELEMCIIHTILEDWNMPRKESSLSLLSLFIKLPMLDSIQYLGAKS